MITIHSIWEDHLYPELSYPPIDEAGARDAIPTPDGGSGFVEKQDALFVAGNTIELAMRYSRAAAEELAAEENLLRGARRDLARTSPTTLEVTSERHARQPFITIVESLVLIAMAGAALWASNYATAKFIASSDSPLFPSDFDGARIFAFITVLGAVGLKMADHVLRTDAARHVLRQSLLAVGVIALLGWTLAAAVAFAPDFAPASMLTPSSNGKVITVVLVFSQLLGDVAWGCLIYSCAVERLLGTHKRIEVPNPSYAVLMRTVAETEARASEARRALGMAEAHIAKVAAARIANKEIARATYYRACEQYEHAQTAAQAMALGTFFKC